MAAKKWQKQVKRGDRAKGPDFYNSKVIQGEVLECNDRFVFIRREDTGMRGSIRREDLQRPVN